MFLKRYDIIFFCASEVDEVWIRSTVLYLSRFKVKICVIVYDPYSNQKPKISTPASVKIITINNFSKLKKYEAVIVVSASTNLKKDFFCSKIKYFVHMPHSLVSLHGAYQNDAFDTFNILFASTEYHINEFKEIADIRGIKNPRILKTGYGKLDILMKNTFIPKDKNHFLIAASWGNNNILETSGYELCNLLLKNGHKVTLRPHPMFYLDKKDYLSPFLSIQHVNFKIESFFENEALFIADVLITDYSGIAFEYLALRPAQKVVFVDVQPKILNANIIQYQHPLFEVEKRHIFGKVIKNNTKDIIDSIQSSDNWPKFECGFVYNLGACGMIASHQLMDIL